MTRPKFRDIAAAEAFQQALQAVCDLNAAIDLLESVTHWHAEFATTDGRLLRKWIRSQRTTSAAWYEYQLAAFMRERDRKRRGR